MTQRTLTICHLYPREMNTTGDVGNILVLTQRMLWRGIKARVVSHHVGDVFSSDVDIVISGGAEGAQQLLIQPDLLRIAAPLKALIEDGMPALAICGSFQLFGSHIITVDRKRIEGIGVFDMHTLHNDTRMTGNLVTESLEFGTIIGYEHHTGSTMLGTTMSSFGHVVSGAGNNGVDKREGALYKNAIGSYLIGPLLPKNPRVADFLIQAALEKKYNEQAPLAPLPLDRELAEPARSQALSRGR